MRFNESVVVSQVPFKPNVSIVRKILEEMGLICQPITSSGHEGNGIVGIEGSEGSEPTGVDGSARGRR
jgi:hypothetical protein